jgi:hypothetical protein
MTVTPRGSIGTAGAISTHLRYSAIDSRLTGEEKAPTITAHREQLFKVSAVIEMCRYACASKLEGFDPEQLAVAPQAADDMIRDAAAALEPMTVDDARSEVTAIND